MKAYQNFLAFFLMHNKERLDGLSESYFVDITQEERGMAFMHQLRLVECGGAEESVHGLLEQIVIQPSCLLSVCERLEFCAKRLD